MKGFAGYQSLWAHRKVCKKVLPEPCVIDPALPELDFEKNRIRGLASSAVSFQDLLINQIYTIESINMMFHERVKRNVAHIHLYKSIGKCIMFMVFVPDKLNDDRKDRNLGCPFNIRLTSKTNNAYDLSTNDQLAHIERIIERGIDGLGRIYADELVHMKHIEYAGEADTESDDEPSVNKSDEDEDED